MCGNFDVPEGLSVEEREEGLFLCCSCERDVEFSCVKGTDGRLVYECLECGESYVGNEAAGTEPVYCNVNMNGDDEEIE